MIYTSGSTGKPKGVMIENRNVVNFFDGMDRVIGAGPGTWLAVTSTSFDISVLELLWTLTRGFTVVLHAEGGSVNDEIARWRVTHLQMTPSLARMLTFDAKAYAALGALKQILLGGEAVPAALVRHLRKVFKGELFNMYGPTETTVWSTAGKIEETGSVGLDWKADLEHRSVSARWKSDEVLGDCDCRHGGPVSRRPQRLGVLEEPERRRGGDSPSQR